MPEVTFLGPATPVWVYVVNVGQVLLVLWLGFVLLLGSWKLFRFLIKWKP